MRGPYGFEMNENCQTCKLRKSGYFCELQGAALKNFDAAKASSVYPEGAVLFIEKQEARGVFVLCEGQVKLSISSAEGKTLILRIAKPGEVLGLEAVVGGTSYEVTAETLRPCQVAFVRRDDFLRFIAHNPEVYQNIVKQMASVHQGVCEQLRNVGLAASAPARLAKLLLDWSNGAEETKGGSHITMPLTHEEIGEFIGSSRETVTRTFSDFKSRHLIALKGSTVTIPSRAALENVAGA
ncbi:MAG TPA: Crp/Fnr family transcriptional regulator [Candidatus Acidoferrales bacterium]|nr:Crp/Fnr family transcriptional regulator [Candidatus Acidoferrales bacterium]